MKAFAAAGFDASVRDIAEAADVRHSTIRYHFVDKEGLWSAVVNLLFERLRREVRIKSDERDLNLAEQFRRLIERYVQYCASYPEHARIMAHESMRDSKRFEMSTKTMTKPDHKKLVGILAAMIKQNLLPDVSVISLTYAMVGIAQTPFVLGTEIRHLYGLDVFHESFVESHSKAVYELLIRSNTLVDDRGADD